MQAIQEVVKEGVLNDDILHIAPDGYKFKGGYQAQLEYYTFANEWNNYKHIKRFKTLDNAYKYIAKNY